MCIDQTAFSKAYNGTSLQKSDDKLPAALRPSPRIVQIVFENENPGKQQSLKIHFQNRKSYIFESISFFGQFWRKNFE